MSKITFSKGNQDFTGYEVITDLPVDKLQGKDFTLTQKQLVTHPTVTNTNFATTVVMSEDGLFLILGSGSSPAEQISLYSRSNTNSLFTFSSNIASGSTYEGAVMSQDCKYLAIRNNSGGLFQIYSRNTTDNSLSLQSSISQGSNGIAMSSDGNYAFNRTGNTIYPYRRTPNTDTWTALSSFTLSNTISTNENNIDCSSNGDRFIARTSAGSEIWRKTSNTTWAFEQTIGSGESDAQMNDDGDLVIYQQPASNYDIEIHTRSGTTWSLVHTISQTTDSRIRLSKNGDRLFVVDATSVNGIAGTMKIYRRITNTNWQLIYTLDSLVANLGTIDNDGPSGFFQNFDGSIFAVGGTVSGAYIYDIQNEVEFEQRIKTKIINFNDTLKITSAFGSADHLVTFPSFNQAGSLINDGGGNCSWGEPFDQGLNKSDAVQFDTIGISPNLGQTTTSSELQLSFRKINESYSGNCIKLRRATDFIVGYALDAELDDSNNLTGTATYNSTGGTSSRGQFTATLSTSGTFIVDGTSLGSGDDGTRILFIGQNNEDENGIYTTTISGTSLTLDRATDFDGDGEVSNGDSFYVLSGSTYADTGFKITTEDSITVGGASGSNLTFSSIDVLKDIGFDPDNTGSGVINLAEVSTVLEDDDGYIHTWYDQSGNSNNFTQTVFELQPQLLLNGGINWLPTASFDGTNDFLSAGDVLDIGTSSGLLINSVVQIDSGGGTIIQKGFGANSWSISYGATGSGTIDFGYEDSVDSSSSTSATPDGSNEIISMNINRTSGSKTYNAYINNSSQFSGVSITEDDTYNFINSSELMLGVGGNTPELTSYTHGFGTSLTNFKYKYRGAYCPNQKRIYMNNNVAETNWHYIDCITGTVYEYTSPVNTGGSVGGMVYSPNEKRIYFPPVASSTTAYYIDCSNPNLPNGTAVVKSYTHGVSNSNTYLSGAYSPNEDRIYFAPFGINSSSWHYVDCSDGSMNTYTGTFSSAVERYHGAVYSPNQDRIYFIPASTGGITQWDYIDCTDGTAHQYSHGTGISEIGWVYADGVYSPNQDRIYLAPFRAALNNLTWHYIDCSNASQAADTATVTGYTHPTSTSHSYRGAVYDSINDRVYFIKSDTTALSTWFYIDCSDTNDSTMTKTFTHGATLEGSAYSNGTYDPCLHRIYLNPYGQSDNATWHYIECSNTKLDGKISEIIINTNNVTNPERVGIEQEQANYYGITISEMPKINFKIDTTIASNYNITFPASQGGVNQTLLNDGSGNLSWSKTLFRVRTETTGTTLADDYILNMNNSGTVTVNVPDATATSSEGVEYVIIKQTGNQVDVTSVVASQLFSGGSTFTTISLTGAAGERIVLLCNGTYWYVM